MILLIKTIDKLALLDYNKNKLNFIMKEGTAMSNKIVQISFSDSEMTYLTQKAEHEGISVALYIKNSVLLDTEFKKCFEELKTKVARIKVGIKFNIKAVFGTDWTNIEKGVRLALGKAFYTYVHSGSITNVKILDKDSANTQWYEII